MNNNVYVLQINTPTDRNLLPLAAGMLVSYSKSIPKLNDFYDFEIMVLREKPEETARAMTDPKIVGFSCYSWNIRQSIEIAKFVKQQHPEAVIIFGGPSSPAHGEVSSFSEKYPWIDVFVHGEGELVFAEILFALIENQPLSTVEGIAFLDSLGGLAFTESRQTTTDLETLASPFLDGTFDSLLHRFPDVFTGSLWETNRGCPFGCTFCYWGQVQKTRVREFPEERVFNELQWISQNKIRYVYASDANFGILKRDLDIAKEFARSFEETGFPSFLMVNWTKHSSDAVLRIADALKQGGLDFRVTLSVQSFNPSTLQAVKRYNMSTADFNDAVKTTNALGFGLHTDLILGLPNETYHSFVAGLNNILFPYLDYYFSIYLCRLLNGSEMANPDYVSRYQLKTRSCLVEMGRRESLENGVPEYEDLVVSTSTCSVEEWKNLYNISYCLVTLYNYRVAFFVMNYLKYELDIDLMDYMKQLIHFSSDEAFDAIGKSVSVFEATNQSILDEKASVAKSRLTGQVALEPSEAALLQILSDKQKFYLELLSFTNQYLQDKGVTFDELLLKQIFAYQEARVQTWSTNNHKVIHFDYNIPQYFDELCLHARRIGIEKAEIQCEFGQKGDYWPDAIDFVNSVIKAGQVSNLGITEY